MNFIPADVSVPQFRQALRDAADRVEVIEPESLREPVRLWLRAVEADASRWKHLLGRPSVAAWNAAQAILTEHARRSGSPS